MSNPHNSLHTVASHGNLGPVFLGLDYAIFSLSTIVVLIRLYTRVWITRNVGWDDAVMALTQAITAVGKGFVVTEVSYGLGQHRNNLSVQNYRKFLKYEYLDTAQFFLALATCKISICLFLLRLSQFDKLKRLLWALIGFLVVTHVALFLLTVLQCSPVHKAWDLGTPGQCFSPQMVVNINVVQAVFSFLTDFVCAAFPLVLLRKLQIRRQSYIGLCCLMGLGVITGAIAIARTATMHLIKAEDLSWVGVPNFMTRIFEVNIGNIAACMPLLKPFVRYVHAKITGTDPHQILHRKASDHEAHERWYRRDWRSLTQRTGRGYESRPQEMDLPLGAVKTKAGKLADSSLITETSRSGSLRLPVQGVRKGDEDDGSLPDMPNFLDSHYYQSTTYPLELGEVRSVRDRF